MGEERKSAFREDPHILTFLKILMKTKKMMLKSRKIQIPKLAIGRRFSKSLNLRKWEKLFLRVKLKP